MKQKKRPLMSMRFDFFLLNLSSLLLYRERREHRIFDRMLQMIPGLEKRLFEGSNEEVVMIAELV